MKIRKSWLLAAMALTLVAAVAVTAGGDKAAKVAKLKAELNLTDQQVSRIEQTMDQLQPVGERIYALKDQLKSLQAATNPDQKAISAKESELMAAKKEYHDKWDASLKSTLTSEQWAKYEQMHANYKKAEQAKKN